MYCFCSFIFVGSFNTFSVSLFFIFFSFSGTFFFSFLFCYLCTFFRLERKKLIIKIQFKSRRNFNLMQWSINWIRKRKKRKFYKEKKSETEPLWLTVKWEGRKRIGSNEPKYRRWRRIRKKKYGKFIVLKIIKTEHLFRVLYHMISSHLIICEITELHTNERRKKDETFGVSDFVCYLWFFYLFFSSVFSTFSCHHRCVCVLLSNIFPQPIYFTVYEHWISY